MEESIEKLMLQLWGRKMITNFKMRGIGIIVKDNKILLMKRVRNGKEYYIFPGGGVEENETPEEATIREIREELTLEAKIDKFLFKMFNPGQKGSKFYDRDDYFFLVTEFDGEVQLGGEELERMDESDQFYPEWHDMEEAASMKDLFPEKARLKLFEMLKD